MNKTWKIPSCLFIFFFQKRNWEEGKVKVFCFCDALWSLGDDNSFYPFRLKCQYDNSLHEENVHFFLTFSIARHLIIGCPTFIFHMPSWARSFLVSISLKRLLYDSTVDFWFKQHIIFQICVDKRVANFFRFHSYYINSCINQKPLI